MFNIPDHPIIRKMETVGYDDGPEPICPICGEECETMYKDKFGAYVGCDVCITMVDACDVEDCFPEQEEE